MASATMAVRGLVHLEQGDGGYARADEGQDPRRSAQKCLPPAVRQRKAGRAGRPPRRREGSSSGESATQSMDGVGNFVTAPPRTRAADRVSRPAPPNEWSVIAAGQNESASRTATSGDDHADLGRAEVERRVGDRGARIPVEDRGDQTEHVHGREHDRDRARDRPAPAAREDRRSGSGTRPRTRSTRAPRARSLPP